MSSEKQAVITELRKQLEQVTLNEAFRDSSPLEERLQASLDVLTGVKTDIQAAKAKLEVLVKEKNELETVLEELAEASHQHQSVEIYLEQIVQSQQLLTLTKDTIEYLEVEYLVAQKQLESVLQESELGKLVIFVVNDFKRSKKKFLSKQRIAYELHLPLIIVQTHLRTLHALGFTSDTDQEDPLTPYIFYSPYPKGPPAASADGHLKLLKFCPQCGEQNFQQKTNCPSCDTSLLPLI